LEGLEISELLFSELETGIRIDAELYRKDFVLFEKKIYQIKHTLLGDEVKLIKKGIFDIKASCYANKGVPFVRISNLKNCVIDTNDIILIPESENEKNSNTFLRQNDIVLSKTANAAASIVDIPFCNVSQDTVAIKLKDNSQVNSHFVVIYLNTKFGLKQMQRWFTGNIQMHLNLDDCKKNLQLPVFSESFQNKVKSLFVDSISKRNSSKNTYSQAETLLLETIGLNNFQPSTDPVNVKSFKDSFELTGRLDAEYYQKKYEDYSKLIRSHKFGYESLQFACNLKDVNFNPEEKKEYKYIELADIGKSGDITGCTIALGAELPTRARRIVETNDVVISSIEGSLESCALVTKEYNNALCSTGFYVINSSKINSETLLVLFKSEPMQKLLKQNCSGTILTAINKTEFQNIPVPIIEASVQKVIQEKIIESFSLKKDSEQLLEKAKRAVEIAIEESEVNAALFIEKEN
jgi:restriction endonuclease S subunit